MCYSVMMTILRRFLLLMALGFWQGGFTFHAAVVIHVGHDVLGSHLQQGYITGVAANYLNLAGLVTLVLWGWDIAMTKDTSRVRRWVRWAIWVVLLLALGMLTWLHGRLDELLAVESFRILEPPRFYDLHRWYLNISTVQWGGSLLLTLATLLAWRAEDKRSASVA
jgi:hypothetical protein